MSSLLQSRAGARIPGRRHAWWAAAILFGGGATALVACSAIPYAGPSPARGGDFVPRQVLVGYRADLPEEERARLREQAKATGVMRLFEDSELWGLPADEDPAEFAARLSRTPGVRYAQPNYIRRLSWARGSGASHGTEPSHQVGVTPGLVGLPWSGTLPAAGVSLGSGVSLPSLQGGAGPGSGPVFRIQAFSAAEFDPNQDARANPLWHLALIQAAQAWNVDRPGNLGTFSSSNPPGKSVLVAVVDSGVDVRHPDLADNIARDAGGQVRFFDEIKACGRSDVLSGPGGTLYNFDYETAYKDSSHPGPDGNGHGTHVSGIIAAVGNNSPGIECKEPPCNTVGVGPGISILPVKTMNALGDGDDFCIARGLRDAADAGARVINLSVGGPQPGPALEEAIEYLTSKGALLVVASGNDGLRVNYPAAYPGVVAVGSVGHPADAQFPDAIAKGAPYSSTGPELDIVAPGGSDTPDCPEKKCGVYSTVPTYISDISLIGKVVGTGYGRLTGTSMATPQVSAVAALILAREPGLSPRQVRQRLISSTRPVPGTDGRFTDRYGYGLLDPYKALSQVSHDGK